MVELSNAAAPEYREIGPTQVASSQARLLPDGGLGELG